MGTITLRDYPDQVLHFELPDVIDDEIIIKVYDDVTGLTITNCSTDLGFSTNVENNERDLSEFSLDLGKYDIEIHTQSEGVLEQTIEIEDTDSTIIFEKLDFEYELIRIDEEGNTIENTNTENLAETFVSTDEIRIKFNELNGCNLESDGFSYDDIIWKLKGDTTNDGNPDFEINDNLICEFTPNWNTGNYSTNGNYNENAANYPYESGYIAATGNNRFQEIWDELVENYGALCVEAGITNEGLAVNSCYRNPQRNRDVGSVLINSNHTIGHAMDVRFLGIRTSQKWILLNNAAEQIDGVNGICEHGPTQVTCGASNQSHVHLAW